MWVCTGLREIFKLVVANGNVIKRLRRLPEHSWVIRIKIPDHLWDSLPSNTWWFQANDWLVQVSAILGWVSNGRTGAHIHSFSISHFPVFHCYLFGFHLLCSELHFWLYFLLWAANRSKLQVLFCYSGHFSLKGTVGRLNKLERNISSTAQCFAAVENFLQRCRSKKLQLSQNTVFPKLIFNMRYQFY